MRSGDEVRLLVQHEDDGSSDGGLGGAETGKNNDEPPKADSIFN